MKKIKLNPPTTGKQINPLFSIEDYNKIVQIKEKSGYTWSEFVMAGALMIDDQMQKEYAREDSRAQKHAPQEN